MATANTNNDAPKRRELPVEERMLAFQMVYGESKDGRPARGSITQVARMFSVHPKTIGRLWRTIHPNLVDYINENGQDGYKDFCLDADNFRTDANLRGRKKKHDRVEIVECVSQIDLNDRKTIRTMAKKLDIPKSSLHNCIKKENILQRYRSTLKPVLTEANKVSRVFYA